MVPKVLQLHQKRTSLLNTINGDPAFYYKTDKASKELQVTLAFYVDDTLASGDKGFLKLTKKISEKVE